MQYTAKLDEIEKKFDEIESQMADPEVISDATQYRRITKQRS